MDGPRFTATDPLRPADWRFRVAQFADRTDQFLSRRYYDFATRSICSYLRTVRRQGSEAAARLPDGTELRRAYAIFATCSPQLRAAVEAGLLTGATPLSLALTCGVSSRCIQWYESAFFDVRDRLAASAFIVHQIIETAREQSGGDWALFGWKLVGYLVGREGLADAMCATNVGTFKHFLATMSQDTRAAMLTKVRSRIQTLAIDSPDAAARLLQVVEGGNGKSSQEELPDDYQRNVQAALQSIPFKVLRRADPNCPSQEFDACPAELSGAELMAVALGQQLPGAGVIKALDFPAPGSEG